MVNIVTPKAEVNFMKLDSESTTEKPSALTYLAKFGSKAKEPLKGLRRD